MTAMMAFSSNDAHSATTFQVTGGNSGFGASAGLVIAFENDAPASNWTAETPTNSQEYYINTISLIKHGQGSNADFDNLWIGVYDAASPLTLNHDSTGLGTFLGASTSSVAWNSATVGSTVTWSFNDVSLTAAPGQLLVFAFQTSAAAMTDHILVNNNDISIRRMDGNDNTLTNQGAGVIHGEISPARSGYVDNRVPNVTLEITQIPEPSTALLGSLGMLFLLRRRRD